jgi:hypothetical protein
MMRQAVQVLAVVTLDVPANLTRAQTIGAAHGALRYGTHVEATPMHVDIRSLREEAAMFNNEGDQWVRGPHGIYKSDAPQHGIGFAFSLCPVSPFPDRDAMPYRIAEALNFMAGARYPAGLVETFGWALGMATEAISLRENSEDEEDTNPDTLAMHKEQLAKGGELLRALRERGQVPDQSAVIAAAEELLGAYGGDIPDWLENEVDALERAIAAEK